MRGDRQNITKPYGWDRVNFIVTQSKSSNHPFPPLPPLPPTMIDDYSLRITFPPRKKFVLSFSFTGENPEQLAFEPPLPPDGSRINLPLLIMASNRPYYLYRMLKTLRQVQGLNHTMVTVFIDGFFEEPALLAGLYGLNVDQQAGVSERRARISQVQSIAL